MKRYQSYSSAETRNIAAALAKEIARNPRKGSGAAIITLSGELGAGKTTFVKGFARGLGSRARVVSPTFILVRRHIIHNLPFTDLFHIDAYRLTSAKHLPAIGFREVIGNPRHIVLIEWPERISRALPKRRVRVALSHGKHPHERTIVVRYPR